MNDSIIRNLIGSIRKAGIEVHVLDSQESLELTERMQSSPDKYLFRHAVPVPADIFESNAIRALETISQLKATPAQWLAMLTKNGGIKAGEDKWMGLSEWLSNHPAKSIEKSTVHEFIRTHQVTLKEVSYTNPEKSPGFKAFQQEFDTLIQEVENQKIAYESERQTYAFNQLIQRYGDDFDLAFGHCDGKLYVVSSEHASQYLHDNLIHETRMHNTTCNLDDYREIVFYSPDIESWGEDDEIHFGEVGEGRAIAWVRFGEKTFHRAPTIDEKWQRMKGYPGPEGWIREDLPEINAARWRPGDWRIQGDNALISYSEGRYWLHNYTTDKRSTHDSLDEAVDEYINQQVSRPITYKVLVIDEIQSNRHQEGREKGYRNLQVYKEVEDEFFRANEANQTFRETMLQKYGHDGRGAWRINEFSDDEKAEAARLTDDFNRTLANMQRQEIMPPPAPFEKNWHELCMKRMLRYAADHGFDKMVWTTGQQQGNRYNLGYSIKEVVSIPMADTENKTVRSLSDVGSYSVHIQTMCGDIDIVTDTKGIVKQSSDKEYYDKHLEQLVGKNVSSKILGSFKSNHFTRYETAFRIGIDGMRAFYDKMLPSFMNKYGKQWGVSVKDVPLPEIGIMHGIDITQPLREMARQSQPMFMRSTQGQILGMAQGNHIYLTLDGLTPETLVHEYTHLWAAAMRQANPKGWQSIKDLIRNSPLQQDLLSQPGYTHLHDNEDALAMEVLAHISGKANAEKLGHYEQTSPVHWMQRITHALREFWSWVGNRMFGIHTFKSVEEVTDRVLYDLLSANHLDTERFMQQADSALRSRISDVQVFYGMYGNPYVRCKIDGEQQMGKLVKQQDFSFIHDKSRLPELAERYFSDELSQTTSVKSHLKP